MRKTINKVETMVKELLNGEATGHDWYHVHQVRSMALRIADSEGGDRVIIEIAALAHDVGDHKFHTSKEVGQEITKQLLVNAGVPEVQLMPVIQIIDTMSFSGGKIPESLEGKIVQDADRLYALGAIGIARAFAFGGYKGRPIHDPDMQSSPTTIEHFYEKLLHIKQKMNTQTGLVIAQRRHEYMENYLKQFYAEWDARD